MSLTDVAAKAGVSPATLSRIENNKQTLDVALLIDLARAIGIDAADLVGDHGGDPRRDGAIIDDLAALAPADRARLLIAASKRTTDGKRSGTLHTVETLLAIVDVLQGELSQLRHTQKRRK